MMTANQRSLIQLLAKLIETDNDIARHRYERIVPYRPLITLHEIDSMIEEVLLELKESFK